MSFKVFSRVAEISTDEGTDDFELEGAYDDGYRTFATAGYSNGDTCPYVAELNDEWEEGIGTIDSGVLERTIILDSSDSGAKVDFSAGAKRVYLSAPPKLIRFGAAPGHIFGLTLSNNGTDAANDIDIAVGEAATDTADPLLMVLAAALTKRLDAGWAVGSGNGGLDTGSIANNTYHVWLIQRSDTGVVDALFSLSASSPTMPASYDRKRRIGSIIRSGGAILAFRQRGDEFLLDVPVNQQNNNPGTNPVLATLTVPTGVKVGAIFGLILQDTSASAGTGLLVTSPDQAATAPANFTMSTISISNAGGAISEGSCTPPPVRTNTSGQIRYELSASTGDHSVYITTFGWIDTRGRDA